MAKVALSDVLIELHVPDFEVTKRFYKKLGFEVVWEYPSEGKSGYLVMKRQDSIICFYCGSEEVYDHSFFKRFPKDTVRGYGVELAIYISDVSIEDYYSKIKKLIPTKCITQPLKVKPWGRKDFRIVDPFGYYICFREPDNILIK